MKVYLLNISNNSKIAGQQTLDLHLQNQQLYS